MTNLRRELDPLHYGFLGGAHTLPSIGIHRGFVTWHGCDRCGLGRTCRPMLRHHSSVRSCGRNFARPPRSTTERYPRRSVRVPSCTRIGNSLIPIGMTWPRWDVWYLESWARSRQEDAAGLLDTLQRGGREGRANGYAWRERYYPSATGSRSRPAPISTANTRPLSADRESVPPGNRSCVSMGRSCWPPT